ncbi:hypothetical protein RsTz2092_11170 [Deferribacterales bacterium RsTz2092]|nr:hypothetical protein AGMMS49941_12200 [Deferribacterales bacterium]
MTGKVINVLRENKQLKDELAQMLVIAKENEDKQKGFQLVENAFLLAESWRDIDNKALAYLEEIFNFDRVVLFVDEALLTFPEKLERIVGVDKSVLKYAFVEKRPYFGSYLEGLISDFRIADDIGSYLTAPIISNDKIIASLNLYSSDVAKLSEGGNTDFIRQLSFKIAIVLMRHIAGEAIASVKTSKANVNNDYLTGLYSRAVLADKLQGYIDRLKTSGTPFTFILLDIDNFRNVNDKLGHMQGDEILRSVAMAIAGVLPVRDVLGRFGGDEFFIITGKTNEVALQKIFSAIKIALNEVFAEIDIFPLAGVSGGYNIITKEAYLSEPSMTATDVLSAVMRGADNALHCGKLKGKGTLMAAKLARHYQTSADLFTLHEDISVDSTPI